MKYILEKKPEDFKYEVNDKFSLDMFPYLKYVENFVWSEYYDVYYKGTIICKLGYGRSSFTSSRPFPMKYESDIFFTEFLTTDLYEMLDLLEFWWLEFLKGNNSNSQILTMYYQRKEINNEIKSY